MFKRKPQLKSRKKQKKANGKSNTDGKHPDEFIDEIDSDEIPSDDEIEGDGDLLMDDDDGKKKDVTSGEEDNAAPDEDEDVDQKRLKMAKAIVEKARSAHQKKVEDDFFVGVDRGDDDTNQIMEDLKKEKIHKHVLEMKAVADAVHQRFVENDNKAEEITLKGHKKGINCLALDEFNRHLFSASKDGSIIKWDLMTQKKLNLIKDDYFGSNTRTFMKEVLCMDLNFDGRSLLTAGCDKMIRLWDTRDMKLVHTFKGHKDAVQAVKFQMFSNNFCSIGCDRTLQLWDGNELAFLDTYFGHKNDVCSLDAMSENNMISSGFDRQIVYWKTEEEAQLIFNGGDYSIDSVKALSARNFVTGSQDGFVSLWSIKNKHALNVLPKAHNGSWITSLGAIYNSDFFISGSHTGSINAYKANFDERQITKLFELPVAGVVNDIKITRDGGLIAVAESDEYRLGRWVTSKAKPKIKIFKI